MMMPRFIKLLAPSEIDSTKNVLLMKAYEENSGEASYITHDLQGYYLVSEEDLKHEKVAIPTEEELNAFATSAIETYRKREKAAEFIRSLKDVLKADVPNKTVSAEVKKMEKPSVPNFYQFCQDAAIQVQLNGKPVHSFFKPDYFLEFGTGVMREPVVRNQIVDMPIDTFLGLAEPIPADDLKRHAKQEDFKKDVLAGKKTDWAIPYLTIRETEDEKWKVIGHDGRHRAMLLKSLGYKEMPVHIRIPESKLLNGIDNGELWCQNDTGAKRDRMTYPFPITTKNYNEPYIEIEGLKKPTAKAEDELKAKEMTGMAPSSCVEAKSNFEKNKGKKLQMPFSTYYEFVMRQKA